MPGTASLLSSPLSLRAASFADYELPSQLTAEIVSKQGQHLQSLRFACFTGVTSADIRLVLTSCPNMINLCAPEIRMWAGDLIPDVPGSSGGEGGCASSPPPSSIQVAGSGFVGTDAKSNFGRGCGGSLYSTQGRGIEGSEQYRIDQEFSRRYEKALLPPTLDITHSNSTVPQDSSRQKDWVCHKLEKLSIYVSLEPTLEDDETVFYPGSVQEHGCGNIQGLTTPSLAFDKDTQARLFSRQQPQNLEQDQQQKQSWHHFQDRFNHLLQLQHDHHHHRIQHQEASIDRVRVAFLNQLSKLTRLKHLDLSGEHVEKANLVQIGLPWTIAGGIEQLVTLKDLEHIAVTGWVDQMGPEEVSWMKRSWPKLLHVSLLKTDGAGMSPLQGLLAKMWPELTVQDKARNKGNCPPLSSPPPLSPLTPDYTPNNNEVAINTMSDSASNRLPPEIIERALQYVVTSSLPACCLVNKLWSLCARPFLWATISPEDIYDDDFITQFAHNYQHVRDVKIFIPCDSSVHMKLLKPSPPESQDTATLTTATTTKTTKTTTAAAAASSAARWTPFIAGIDKDVDDDERPTATATKTLLDCRRLTALHLHYSASLINTLPHFRDAPHRPNVAPALRLMIKSAEKIIENNLDNLRYLSVTGLCFPVGEPILELLEKMPKLKSLSFLKWVDYDDEKFFRMLVSTSPTLEDLSIELTDLSFGYATIVLLFGWRRVYDEHQKTVLAGKSSQGQVGVGASTKSATSIAATEGAGTGHEGVDDGDEEWIPGTRTTPSFAVMSAKRIAGERPLDQLTKIKSLSLNRSTLSTRLLLQLGALMPELTTLSLKQIYGLGNEDDIQWETDSDGILTEDITLQHGFFAEQAEDLDLEDAPIIALGATTTQPVGSENVVGNGASSEQEIEDLLYPISANDEHDAGPDDEDLEDLPDLASALADTDDDLPELEPVTSPLHVVNPDASSQPTQSAAAAATGISSGHFGMALDEFEMDYEDDDDDYEDDYMYDQYDEYSDDEDAYEDGIWGAGGAHHIHNIPTLGSILAQHVAGPNPYSNTLSTTALSVAFRTLKNFCPKIDTFDFSGSRSEALNEAFFSAICEFWGESDSDPTDRGHPSSAAQPKSTHTGLKVLNAADVCKVEAKFFSSIRQRCSSTLTSLDLSLSPKMMWQLRSAAYEVEVRQVKYYDEILPILMTCPALEHLLVGPYPLNAKKIAAQESNWSVTRLRTLHLCIEFDPPSALVPTAAAAEEVRQIQSKVCQQLGRLSRLESLTLSGGRPVSIESAGERVLDSPNIFGGYTRGVARPGSHQTPRKYISLKLSSGLEHLAGLEALGTLDIVFLGPHGLHQDAEFAWVLAHWPKLHTLNGYWDRAKLRASVRKYREDLKMPANTPASGPGAYFAKRRREMGVRLRPDLELSLDPKIEGFGRRGVQVDERLLDDLFMEEGMETQAVMQENGLHRMYSPAARKAAEAKKAAKARSKAAIPREDELMSEDGDENYEDVPEGEENAESESESDEEGVSRFNWHVRYIGGAAHAPWDAGHGGIRNGELMTEVMRPREGGRSPSPLGTWY
ncbi:hypothetical protein EC991_006570 [Linnemannia zychae]|nr:hypothetical protein EC991_006570 [Linnemannia zychae]